MIDQLKKKIINSPLIFNSTWALLGSIIVRGSGLISGIYIARIIGAEDFGALGILKNFVYSIAIITTMGMGYTVTKFIAENKNDFSTIKIIIKNANKVTFSIAILLALVLIIFSRFFAINLFKNASLNIPVKIVGFWQIFNAFSTLQQGYLAGLSKYKAFAKINIQVGILSFILGVILTKIWSLNGALFSLLLVQIINCILNYNQVTKSLGYKPKTNYSLKSMMFSSSERASNLRLGTNYSLKSMMFSSIPITMHDLSFAFFGWLSSYLLVYYYNYQQLGIYSAAMQWFMIIIFIPSVLRNVILSSIASETYQGKSIINKMIIVTLSVTSLVAILIIILNPVIGKFYGQQFPKFTSVLILLSLTGVLTGVCNVLIQGLIAKAKYWLVFLARFACDLLTVTFFIAIHFSYSYFNGAFALSLSLLLATFIYVLIVSIFYKRICV